MSTESQDLPEAQNGHSTRVAPERDSSGRRSIPKRCPFSPRTQSYLSYESFRICAASTMQKRVSGRILIVSAATKANIDREP
jgi:hypothetical protein